jgi:cell division protein FtsN
LKKQHQVFRQEMTEKAGKEELVNCLEGLDKLETEQKKAKRAVDAVCNKKPVAAFVANGLAITALLIGTGLGFQGFIAKSQVAELVPMISKLQEQVNANPASDAADKEMVHKQLADLAAASSVTSNQIAEINKALQGNSGSAKAGGDFGKQLAELSNQNLQMGAAIETLQSKISALEKGRVAVVAPVPKPEKKKPVVVEENWAVNLIAFKQDWYAKRKAEEFAAKGVPAKVSRSEAKGETWYRLSVDGFKSQYEAAGYAAKIKKTLNLDSVWVTRNKD